MRVLVSTLVPETWVILKGGCSLNAPSNCSDTRGGLFDPSASSTWNDQQTWSLLVENNLGVDQNKIAGDYGYDTLGIQAAGIGGIVLDHQLLAGVQTTEFFVGSIGLAARTSNFNGKNQNQTSLLTSLRDQKLIPSLSYGYTAGASYRKSRWLCILSNI